MAQRFLGRDEVPVRFRCSALVLVRGFEHLRVGRVLVTLLGLLRCWIGEGCGVASWWLVT